MMESDFELKSNRRDFLRTTGRVSLLAGLAAVGGVLLRRRRDPNAVCTQSPSCGGCLSLDACRLPPAHAYKQQQRP